ncbi:flagellar protein FlhE [Serratia fonticola]|uniref:flagellar protein FlhE n=1 Tax=Serratia fonticola TaxID=47917 RepID=UPI0009B7EE60
MMEKCVSLLTILLLSGSAPASMTGSWSRDSVGGHVSVGFQPLSSNALIPPAFIPTNAKATRIHWHISLLSSPLAGLKIQLCHSQGCEQLHGLRGEFTPQSPWPANDTYYFVYTVNTRGQLRPPLQVIRNELTINYKII